MSKLIVTQPYDAPFEGVVRLGGLKTARVSIPGRGSFEVEHEPFEPDPSADTWPAAAALVAFAKDGSVIYRDAAGDWHELAIDVGEIVVDVPGYRVHRFTAGSPGDHVIAVGFLELYVDDPCLYGAVHVINHSTMHAEIALRRVDVKIHSRHGLALTSNGQGQTNDEDEVLLRNPGGLAVRFKIGPQVNAGEFLRPLAREPREKWGPLDLAAAFACQGEDAPLDRTRTQRFEDVLRWPATDHVGVILNERPGDTGDQGGFGGWKHLDAIVRQDMEGTVYDYLAIDREARRPVYWHELTDRFPLVSKVKHPRCTFEGEDVHWSHSRSPDRLHVGNIHREWYSGWLGCDYEHWSTLALAESVRLYSDPLQMHLLHHRVRNLSMADYLPLSGRALGRTMESLFAIGLDHVPMPELGRLEAMALRWLDDLAQEFDAVNGIAEGDVLPDPRDYYYALRLFKDDPWTGIPGLEVVVWEDALSVVAIDVWAKHFENEVLRLYAEQLALSILLHGFDEHGRIYKAIKWCGPGRIGKDRRDSSDTNYSTWALPCLGIAQRGAARRRVTELELRAKALIGDIRSRDYSHRPSYLFAVPELGPAVQ